VAEGWEDGEGGWLLFDWLDEAESLWDAWRSVAGQQVLSDAQRSVLGEALELIAQMHACGLWQDDLHLDNLLRTSEQLFVVDGGGVRSETPGRPLSRDRVVENLGVFFAQLPAELEPFIEELLVHYLLANSEHALPLEALLKEMHKTRNWRLNDYLKKVARDCSLFSARIGPFCAQAVRREEEANLQSLLADPDAFMAQGTLYKGGGTATVARVELDGRAQAFLASEPGLAQLGRRQSFGLPGYRHAPAARGEGAALVLVAWQGLADYRAACRRRPDCPLAAVSEQHASRRGAAGAG